MVQPFLHLVQAAADIPCLVVVAYLVLVATGQACPGLVATDQACPGLVEVGLAFQALAVPLNRQVQILQAWVGIVLVLDLLVTLQVLVGPS